MTRLSVPASHDPARLLAAAAHWERCAASWTGTTVRADMARAECLRMAADLRDRAAEVSS